METVECLARGWHYWLGVGVGFIAALPWISVLANRRTRKQVERIRDSYRRRNV